MKGGEKVQVGGLGFVNSMLNGGKSSQAVKGLNFAGHLGSLMNSENVSAKTDSLNQVLNGLSSKDLKDLLNFLQSDDVLDLKDGMKLLDQVSSSGNNDLLSIIKSYLGLNDQDVKEMVKNLQSLLSNVSAGTDKTAGNVGGKSALNAIANSENSLEKSNGKTASNLENSLEKSDDDKQLSSTDSKEMDELLACLNQIISLPKQDLSKMMNQDFNEMVKVVKIYELLTKNHDGLAKDTKMADLIQQTIQKVEMLVDQNKETPRNEYLQKTFSSLAAELKSSKQSETVQEKSSLTFKLDPASGMVHLQQMSKPEQIMIMLDKSGRPVSTEQLIQQFENILSKSQFSNAGGTQKLFIKLNPENLGSLRIELTQKDATLIAKIMTTTGAAKETIESQLQGLKHAFSAQNIQVDRIEVTQQGMNQQERFFQRDQQHGQQPREEQPHKEQTNDGEFNQSFEEALLNVEV